MNVRLKKTFSWLSSVVHDTQFVTNSYRVDVSLLTTDATQAEQNIAYDRMKFWIHEVLENSIMIHNKNPKLANYQNTDARVLALPEEPVDQIVGIILYTKLAAIVEDRLIITDVDLQSYAGDDMVYHHNCGDAITIDIAKDGWWNDCRPIWSQIDSKKRKNKIVSLDRSMEWKDCGLEWVDQSGKENSVVFAKFNRDETK